MVTNSFYLKSIIIIFVTTVCDIAFDYGFNFEGNLIISFIFTLLTAIVVFITTGKLAHEDSCVNVNNFIKSNFDKTQVILSCLDVICGIVSICFGVGLIVFKVLKIVWIPTKMYLLLNKGKTLAKFSIYWLGYRSLNKTNKEDKMNFKEFLITNKWTIFWATISGVLGSLSSLYFVMKQFGILWLDIVTPIVAFVVCVGMTRFIGYDTVKGLALREAHKVLPEDKYNELVSIYEAFEASAIQRQKDEEEFKKQELAKIAKAIESGDYKLDSIQKIVTNENGEQVVYVQKTNN